MTETKRTRLGIGAVALGSVMFVFGVLLAHFAGLPPTDDVGRELYSFIPRCALFEDPAAGTCWIVPTTGQIIAFLGSQLILGGIVFAYVYEREMTWARATVGAAIFTLEMLILFGVVPNQWLALTQGTFEWTSQKVAFTIPKWLVLNNDVSISYGVIKDVVAGGYSAALLGAVAVGAYQWQERAKRKGQPKPVELSTYGRPVVKGGR